MQLAPNFYVNEFLHEGITLHDLTKHQLNNLIILANRLQVIRDYFYRVVRINSGFRTPEHNKAIGGVPSSYHLRGMAGDIAVIGIDAREVQEKFKNWHGGMGSYETFTHFDIRPTKARWPKK